MGRPQKDCDFETVIAQNQRRNDEVYDYTDVPLEIGKIFLSMLTTSDHQLGLSKILHKFYCLKSILSK